MISMNKIKPGLYMVVVGALLLFIDFVFVSRSHGNSWIVVSGLLYTIGAIIFAIGLTILVLYKKNI